MDIFYRHFGFNISEGKYIKFLTSKDKNLQKCIHIKILFSNLHILMKLNIFLYLIYFLILLFAIICFSIDVLCVHKIISKKTFGDSLKLHEKM